MGTIGIWLIVVILLIDLYFKYYHKKTTNKPANTASKILNKVIDTFHNPDSTISPSFQNNASASRPRMLRVYTEDGLYLFDRPENSTDIHELVGTKYKLIYRDTGEIYEPAKSN